MKISTTTRARLRLAAVSLALVPLALLARACYSERLSEIVQRVGAREWQRHDRTVKDAR